MDLAKDKIRVNAVCPEAGSAEMMRPYMPEGVDLTDLIAEPPRDEAIVSIHVLRVQEEPEEVEGEDVAEGEEAPAEEGGDVQRGVAVPVGVRDARLLVDQERKLVPFELECLAGTMQLGPFQRSGLAKR